MWWGADEYEVLVDAERGILLRCASRLGGRDFDALEVEEVFFDERFGREVFDSRALALAIGARFSTSWGILGSP